MLGNSIKQQLQPLLQRSITTSSAANAALPALASSSGGLISSIFGFSGSRIDVPLDTPLQKVPEPFRSGPPATKPSLQTSSLDSGAKLSTIDSVSPLSTIALFAEGGSSYETEATTGASKVLEALAFRSSTNRTTFRITRELEKLGAQAYAKAGREHVAFGIDFVRIHPAEAVEVLLDSVLNARYSFWEVRDHLEALREQLADQLKDPNTVLTEVLHRAAFDGSLGNSLVIDPSLLAKFNNEQLKAYSANVLVPSRIVLAGVGVDHGEVKALANPLFSGSGSAAGASGLVAQSTYVGGGMNALAPASPLTHVALGFEVKGGLSDPKSAALAAVFKALLEEARPTLPRQRTEHEVFQTVGSFAHVYKSTGVVGISAAGAPSQAGKLVDAVSKKVEAVAKGVSEAQLSHAKGLAIGAYKAATSTSSGLVSAIGASILATGKFDANEFPAKVQAVTAAEVAKYVSTAIKSSPTFVSYGSLASLPRYDSIAKRFA